MVIDDSYYNEILSRASEPGFSHEQERLRRNEPPGPPFNPLIKYIDESIIVEIASMIVDIIEANANKDGYIIIKGKKEELKEKFYASITGWGSGSNYFFSKINSKEFLSKTALRKFSSFFGEKKLIMVDLSRIIIQVLEKLEFPPIREWINKEYLAHRKYAAHKYEMDANMRRIHNQRKQEEHRNVSSSPLTG